LSERGEETRASRASKSTLSDGASGLQAPETRWGWLGMVRRGGRMPAAYSPRVATMPYPFFLRTPSPKHPREADEKLNKADRDPNIRGD